MRTSDVPTASPLILPPHCEQALLDRFLRAEAMALRSVQAAQGQPIPPDVLAFLHHHEQDEERHLAIFEGLLSADRLAPGPLPRVPRQWSALAVHLYGYEALGLEFAKLLVALRPDLEAILEDERRHVGFFERQVRHVLSGSTGVTEARLYAQAWWRRLPKTLDRYLRHDALAPFRAELQAHILDELHSRFVTVGLVGAEC